VTKRNPDQGRSRIRVKIAHSDRFLHVSWTYLYLLHLFMKDTVITAIFDSLSLFIVLLFLRGQLQLPGMSLQKLQGRLVKLIHLLIERCVRTSLKNHQLGVLDVLLHRVSKTG
jgi:hypothetical protein